MQVTKEGIERIKAANELAAVIAERGIEVRRKGRVLVALPLPRGEDGVLQRHAGQGALPLLRLRRSRRRHRLRDPARQGEFPRGGRGGWRGVRARSREADGGRPRNLQATPLEILTPPAARACAGTKAAAKGAPHQGDGRSRRGDSSPASSSTTTGPSASATTPRRTSASAASPTSISCARIKVGYADGSLLRALPEAASCGTSSRARRHHGRGPRAARRLHRRPDPRSAQRRMDDTLRPRAADAAPLLPAGPAARRPQLPGRALLVRGRSSPRASSTRSASTRPASRRRSRSTARAASRRITSTCSSARG